MSNFTNFSLNVMVSPKRGRDKLQIVWTVYEHFMVYNLIFLIRNSKQVVRIKVIRIKVSSAVIDLSYVLYFAPMFQVMFKFLQ